MPGNYQTFGAEPDGEKSYYVYSLACFATIGGWLFGYNTGIMSGSMLVIEQHFLLSIIWKELIVSGAIGGAAFFALFAGYGCDIYGRKAVIMLASLAFIIGAGISGAAVSKEMLLVGRIIVGVGIGFASMTVPVYLAETAPRAIRGRLVSLNQLAITIGILTSSATAGAFSQVKDVGWRYMLGLGSVPAIVQLIGFIFLPESPRWLVSKGKDSKARIVLQKVNGVTNVEHELQDIQRTVDEEQNQPGWVIGRVLRTPHVRKALFVGCSLHIFQQLSGINSVIYYSGTILEMSGFPTGDAIWLVCVPNAINFLATIIAVILVENVGRKKLMVTSLIGVFFATTILATGFQLAYKFSPAIDKNITEKDASGQPLKDGCYDYVFSDCVSCFERPHCGFCYLGTGQSGSCLKADPDSEHTSSLYGRCKKTAMGVTGTKWSFDFCPTEYNYMALLGMAWFVLCFAPGLGPMTWTINSEIYPLWARGTCFAIGTGVNWTCNLLVSISFLTLTVGITNYGTFWLYAAVCFVGLLVTLGFVPETKNRTLEEMERLFGAQNTAVPATGLPTLPKDVVSGPLFLTTPSNSRIQLIF